jgi:DNA-binding beta-propeller fold protein YncE
MSLASSNKEVVKGLSKEYAFLSESISDYLPPDLAHLAIEYLPIREKYLREWMVELGRDDSLDIAVSGDRIYVLVSGYVKIYNLEGRLLDRWDLNDEKYRHLDGLANLAGSPQGEIFGVNYSNVCIQNLSPEGAMLKQWKGKKKPLRRARGRKVEKIEKKVDQENPLSCPVSSIILNNKLYVIDIEYGGILVYSLQGELLQKLILPEDLIPTSFTISPDERYLYATDEDNNRVLAYDLKDRSEPKIHWSLGSIKEKLFSAPNGIVFLPRLNCFVQSEIHIADVKNNRIRVVDQDGQFIRDWDYERSDWGMKGKMKPHTIFSQGRDHEIYVTDSDNSRIYVFQQTYF